MITKHHPYRFYLRPPMPVESDIFFVLFFFIFAFPPFFFRLFSYSPSIGYWGLIVDYLYYFIAAILFFGCSIVEGDEIVDNWFKAKGSKPIISQEAAFRRLISPLFSFLCLFDPVVVVREKDMCVWYLKWYWPQPAGVEKRHEAVSRVPPVLLPHTFFFQFSFGLKSS